LVGVASPVAVEGEGVDHEGVAEEVEVLAGVAEAVGASDPEGVVDAAVDGFGVEAAGVEAGEVGVGGRDGPDIFGAVELAGFVASVGVHADGQDSASEVVGEAVVAVPAVTGVLVAVAMGADPVQRRIKPQEFQNSQRELRHAPANSRVSGVIEF
jgi:hypothetical protein